MTAQPSPCIPRREFARGGFVVFASGLGSLPAIYGCGKRVASNEQLSLYQVSGASMNPTLWGPSRSFNCLSCDVTIRVDEFILQAAWERSPENSTTLSAMMCWHCGSPIEQQQLSAALQGPGLPPDVVGVTPTATTDYKVGDILLIRKTGVQVKRLLGRPGQTISLDDAGRLLVDGQRPTFHSPPRVAVDFDRFRDSSRWHGPGESARWHGADESARWQRRSDRSWTALGDTGWLVYAHQNVYRGPRPSRVLDDLPGNFGLQRALFPVDGLSIQFELATSADHEHREIRYWIAFWTERGIDLQPQIVEAGSKYPVKVEAQAWATLPRIAPKYDFMDTPTMLDHLLSPQCPIAVQLSGSSEVALTIRDLAVQRDVLYRVNPSAPRGGITDQYQPPSYPIHLGDDEWFVVGDNVPVSIDSRHWGAVATEEIIGRVGTIRG